MKRTYMIKEFIKNEDSNEYVVHIINTEDNNPNGGWYRQITALEGMVERSSKRWFDFWNGRKNYKSFVRFDRWNKTEEKIYLEQREKYIKLFNKEETDKLFPELNKINHNSVWDFFEYIDYDHKNKKVSNIDKLIITKKLN